MALLRISAAVRAQARCRVKNTADSLLPAVSYNSIVLFRLGEGSFGRRRYATVVDGKRWSDWDGKVEQTPPPPTKQLSHENGWKNHLWSLASSKFDAHRAASAQEKERWLARLHRSIPEQDEAQAWRYAIFQALNSENPIETVETLVEHPSTAESRAALESPADFPLDPAPTTSKEASRYFKAAGWKHVKNSSSVPKNSIDQTLGREGLHKMKPEQMLEEISGILQVRLWSSAVYKGAKELPKIYTTIGRSDYWVCLLHVQMGSSVAETTAGVGQDKIEAKATAWLRVLSKLHVSGKLKRLIAPPAVAPPQKKAASPQPQEEGRSDKELGDSQEGGVPRKDVGDLPRGRAKSLEKLFDTKNAIDPAIPPLYPDAPAGLWKPEAIATTINNACIAARERFQLEGTTRVLQGVGVVNVVVYNLNLQILDISVKSTGTGANKVLAKRQAWIRMLSKLHDNGTLWRLFVDTPDAEKMDASDEAPKAEEMDASDEAPKAEEMDASDDAPTAEAIGASDENPIAEEKDASDGNPKAEEMDEEAEVVDIDKLTLRNEKDATIEIYNYAASLGAVPDISIRAIQPRSQRLALLRKKKQPATTFAHVSIKLPQLDLNVSKISTDAKRAVVAAAIAFKQLAEERRLQSCDLPSEAEASDPNFSFLTVESAREFFAYYRARRRQALVSLEYETAITMGKPMYKAQLSLDGNAVGEPVLMASKKDAGAVAYLTGAIAVTRAEPDMLSDFAEALRKNKGTIPSGPFSVPVTVRPSVLGTMRNTLISARDAGLPDLRETMSAEPQRDSDHQRNLRDVPRIRRDAASERHLALLHEFETDPNLRKKREDRALLPMMQNSSSVLEQTSASLHSIIIGATGSGKTTQVPQIILDDAIRRGKGGFCDVICTQPRRIAASSVAQRVAAERNEPLGQTVGYHVRQDARLPKFGGSITYCTTGILLEQLKHSPDAIMDTVSHIVIDEVHERDLQIDFLMIILKKAVKARQNGGKPVPKIILMSATLDADQFSQYLGQPGADGQHVPCPTLSVPGRTFPVSETYLDDLLPKIKRGYESEVYQLFRADRATWDFFQAELKFAGQSTSESAGIEWKRDHRQELGEDEPSAIQEKEESLVPINLIGATIAHICRNSEDGAILTFLPGLQEISDVQKFLTQSRVLGVDLADESKFKILVLHSSVPPEDQKAVLEPTPPGCRKIILSTNIAETSVTVPDVKHVVDSGKLREKRYDQTRRITKLQCTWESNSNAKQRAGRAGRVQKGNYYAVYSRRRRENMAASGLPELLRSDLQETCLSIKAQGFDEPVSSFLSQAIEPPSPIAVDLAVKKLQAMEALTATEQITSLGRILSQLPVHPALGKMILLGIIFRCLDPLLILGSLDTARPLFVRPVGKEQEAKASRKSYGHDDSDHLTILAAFKEVRHERQVNGRVRAFQLAQPKFVHFGGCETVAATAEQILQVLREAGLIARKPVTGKDALQYGGEELNRNSNNHALVKSLLLAGTHPNLGVKTSPKSAVFRTPTARGVLISPGSQNSKKKPKEMGEDALFAYSTLAKSMDGDRLFMRDSSRVTPLMAMLFGGKLHLRGRRQLDMDDWLSFKIQAMDAKLAAQMTLEFRKALDRMLFGAFKSLSELPKGQSLADDPMRDEFVSGVVACLAAEQSSV